MQAIQTKVLPATNTRPTRIKATCARGSITRTVDDMTLADAHSFTAKALCQRFAQEDLVIYGTPLKSNPWMRPLADGTLPDGSVAHVFRGGVA